MGLGSSLALTGSRFRGVGEGSGGNGSQDSPGDYPLVQLRSVESGQSVFLLPAPGASWSATSFTSAPVSGFPAGCALATVFVNGIPSTSSLVRLLPSLVANNATYARAPGLSLKIKIADIASDANQYALTVPYLGPSTNGAVLSANSTYIFWVCSRICG